MFPLVDMDMLISDPRRGCLWDCRCSFFFFFSFFFRHDFVRPIFLEPLLAETPNWVCCLVLWSSCALLLTIQFALLFFIYLFFFFFRQDFVRVISLEPLLAEAPNWVCCLVLRSSFALLLTIQFASLFFYFILFFFFSATILSGPYLWNRYSQRLQIECAAWSCGLILHYYLPSNSLRYWTKVRGIAPRSHTGRPRTCLVVLLGYLLSSSWVSNYIVITIFI